MIARVHTIKVRPDKIAALDTITNEVYAPLFERLPGCRGGWWLADETTGKATQITLWESEAAIRGMAESAEREAIDRQYIYPLLAADPQATFENQTFIAAARDMQAAWEQPGIEANKAVVRRYIEEANNGGNIALVDALVAPDYVRHSGPANREELKRFLAWQRATAPDWRIEIETMVAEDDRVTVHATASGTRTEESPGVPFAAPQWQEIAWIAMYRLAGGQIAEVWNGICR